MAVRKYFIAVLHDGRSVSGSAANRSDFLDALEGEGFSRFEVGTVIADGSAAVRGTVKASVVNDISRYFGAD
ncbi:MAG: hypothetical protein EBS89_04605, partial [Proteobacteria bacterium]|nr:hypothetical protein [Pseudomonadota bacterium]